ncbi:MAG: hypothetical protein DRJ26_04695 [Candidatus Methanomethylicota archaeon]|uniref:Uncharacterized protein n=1 Tax=Thermoproteota archaeon TaxID=2056631 RepID=A0A497EZ54_9CREN|nr:MAG: hypothetical protein DRJ26_04695 [Candidatus Verstraetearchaeota archaeon]
MDVVLVTRHCLKRILERARILDENERMKLIENILIQGEIVDKKGRNFLVKLDDHYLILRQSKVGLVAISYTRRVIPRGFTERFNDIRLEKSFKLKKIRS